MIASQRLGRAGQRNAVDRVQIEHGYVLDRIGHRHRRCASGLATEPSGWPLRRSRRSIPARRRSVISETSRIGNVPEVTSSSIASSAAFQETYVSETVSPAICWRISSALSSSTSRTRGFCGCEVSTSVKRSCGLRCQRFPARARALDQRPSVLRCGPHAERIVDHQQLACAAPPAEPSSPALRRASPGERERKTSPG